MEQYALIIDKDTSKALQAVSNLIISTPHFLLFLEEEGMTETTLGFFELNADKAHEKDWCIDPECEIKAQ